MSATDLAHDDEEEEDDDDFDDDDDNDCQIHPLFMSLFKFFTPALGDSKFSQILSKSSPG